MVTLNGSKVAAWTFDTNNVLSFEHQAGYSAWLQFTHLPGGPLFMGTVTPSCEEGYVSDVSFQVPPLLPTDDNGFRELGCACAAARLQVPAEGQPAVGAEAADDALCLQQTLEACMAKEEGPPPWTLSHALGLPPSLLRLVHEETCARPQAEPGLSAEPQAGPAQSPACMRAQVFGEPQGAASRALPGGGMDTTMGQLAGVGMGAASAILFAHLLKGASLCAARAT